MNDLKAGEHDLFRYLSPDSFVGAIGYLVIAVTIALVLSRLLRAAVHAAMTRKGSIDRTTISFLQQVATALIWVVVLILYAHLIPVLRSMGTALLAGASVASVVIGLAAQSTLGNLVAGVSITIYRPFRLGDTLQVAAPTGTEIGVVELISLGYTTLRSASGHAIVVPNSLAASQVTINLNNNLIAAPIAVNIQLSRDSDWEAARKLALAVAAETLGEKSSIGCFVTKVETTAVSLQLTATTTDVGARDELRSTLLSALARRFAATEAEGGGHENLSLS